MLVSGFAARLHSHHHYCYRKAAKLPLLLQKRSQTHATSKDSMCTVPAWWTGSPGCALIPEPYKDSTQGTCWWPGSPGPAQIPTSYKDSTQST